MLKRTIQLFTVILAAFILLSVVGCKTTSLGTEWESTESYTKTNDLGEFESQKIEYNIAEPKISDNMLLSVSVSELRTTEKYRKREIITIREYVEYAKTKIECKGADSGAVAGGFSGLFGGLLTVSNQTENPNSVFLLGMCGGSLVGGLIGYGIGYCIDQAISGGEKESIRRTPTGNTKEVNLGTSVVTEVIDKTTKKGPAKTIVSITSKDIKFKNLDRLAEPAQKKISVNLKNGAAKVSLYEDIVEFGFEKQNLIDEIKEWEEIEQIKEPTRSKLLPSILSCITGHKCWVDIKTSEYPSASREITNDQKEIAIPGYRMPADKVYSVLLDFINNEINTKIEKVSVKTVKLPDNKEIQVLMVANTDATKRGLAEKHFSGDILKFAVDNIKPFETSIRRILGSGNFNLYTPSAYTFAVKHDSWNADFLYKAGLVKDVQIISTSNNWATTKAELEKKVLKLKIMKEIKPAARAMVLTEIMKKSVEDNYKMVVKSGVSDTQSISISGRLLPIASIRKVLESFIDKEINSRIEDAVITVEDSNSHVELADVKVEMDIDAPSKKEVASNYFSGDLLEWALQQIKTYNRGKASEYTNRQGAIKLSVYIPSKLKFETKHSKYHAYEDATRFTEGKLNKLIRLIDIGKKIRIEGTEKKGGTLIDK